MANHPTHPTGHTPEMHDRPDEWHRHTTAEEPPQVGHAEVANPQIVLAVGLVSFLFVVAAAVVVYFYYITYTTRLMEEREALGLEAEIRAVRRDAMDRLSRGYVWVDEQQGIALIPQAEASRRVITEYTRQFQNQQPRTQAPPAE